MKSHSTRPRGFALLDAATIVLVVAILAALLLVAQPRQRSLGQLGESMSNLREFGVAFEAYGRDNTDLIAAFSWQKGTTPSTYADLKTAGDSLSAASSQAIDIIRRRAGLTQSQLPKPVGWLPHPQFFHLVLADYLASSQPWNTAISPGDAFQLKLARDPLNWRNNGGTSAREPFRSSYELPVSLTTSPDSGSEAIGQGQTHNTYDALSSNVTNGGRLLSDFVYPANKAMVYERHQWFFGPRQPFCLFDEARIPILSADSHAEVRQGALSNRGWISTSPETSSATVMTYTPSGNEPRTNENMNCLGRMRWTRHALAGRDFDAAEVP